MAGEFDTKRFHSQYGFLSEMHQEELKALRENLKRARKLLANSPRDLREEREAEVERLERTVKRAESSVNKDRREKVELEALSKVAKEERDKRKQGKGAWYMKDGSSFDMFLCGVDTNTRTSLCSGQEGVLTTRKVRCTGGGGGQGCCAKGHREEAKESQSKREEKTAVPCRTNFCLTRWFCSPRGTEASSWRAGWWGEEAS